MKKMSLKRETTIQRLQNKNRMVGQTFNPSGITSKQIQTREKLFISEMKSRSLEERKAYWENVQNILRELKKNKIHCSWEWEWCVFKRNEHYLLTK